MRFQKTIIAAAAAAVLFGASQANAFAATQLKTFQDVERGDWAETSIYALTSLGIIAGVGNNMFQGEAPLTREAFVRLLVTSANVKPNPSAAKAPIQDVEAGHWSYEAVQQAYQLGLLGSFVENGKFSPTKEITREEVAELVGRYLLMSLSKAEADKWIAGGWKATEAAKQLKDAPSIRTEVKPYLYYAAERGIMVGDASGEFRPKATLKRKEAASIIERAINDRLKQVKLKASGYYAISSYNNVDKINLMTDVRFGWASLNYRGGGQATLDTKTAPNAVPSGWEAVVAKADAVHAKKELSVFSNNVDGKLSAFLADVPAQDAFVKSLGETLNNAGFGFTGVSIDLEGLLETNEQAKFTAFLKKVKASLGSGKTMSVAVPPNTWYKGYDYKAIGALADQVILMAHDYTYDPDKLPSAPLPLVNEAVQTALAAGIPKEKLTLGISKQGNQWITPAGGATQPSVKPSTQQVEDRIGKAGTTESFALPYFLDYITYNDERGRHEIWYEDERSIERKIWLAKYYGLQGVSFWYMGSFTADDWNVIARNTSK